MSVFPKRRHPAFNLSGSVDMRANCLNIFLIISMVNFAFSAVLTDDNQVVIPTGQQFPEEPRVTRIHSDLMLKDITFRWDSRGSSIVFLTDQLSAKHYSDYLSYQDLIDLQNALEVKIGTQMTINGKTINLNVILE